MHPPPQAVVMLSHNKPGRGGKKGWGPLALVDMAFLISYGILFLVGNPSAKAFDRQPSSFSVTKARHWEQTMSGS